MKYVGCVLIGAMAILCSCRDELRPDLSPAQEGKTNIIVNLTVERSGSKSPASRSPLAPNEDEYTLGFTDAENQINSLTLIMMRIDASGNEVFEASKTIQSPKDTDSDGDYDVEFQLETNDRGTKHFYLGANLSVKHLASFRTQDKVFDAGEEDSGHNIVGALMNVKHSQDDELDGNIGEGSNIVMTAPILVENRQDITIPSGSTEETITIDNPVKLTRTVAKVLLTCVPKSDAEEYVKVIDAKDAETNPEGDGENTGWIKFADVNYMLNVLNRKTYLNYRIEDDNLIDPNYAMGELISLREEGGGYGITDLEAYQREFLYYDTQAMVEMLNKSVPTYKGGERCIVRSATQYDADKMEVDETTNMGNENHYTEGLYCTENTVHNDMTFDKDADFQSAIRYVTTRVMIGAKYTPKQIWNGEDAPVQASTEAEAQGILDEVEDVNNPLEPVTYPAGTFWRDSQGNYYSLAGMKKKLQAAPKTEFSRYDGGWGYYYTYIDENAQNGAISKDTQTRWGIKRNHYYILKVDKIIAPGSPFPGNETMRIHSELVDWVDKGGSEVEIKVPQQSETAQP